MRWLKKFKHLWSVEIKEAPTFDELENQTEKKLKEDYKEKKNAEIENVFSTLESDETEVESEEIQSAPDYDVGEVEVDDLLENQELESHYQLNIVDAKVDGSDEHLVGVEHIEP
ncbi:MAG: hypothetical protein CMB48_07520 [Euryarchaeota archaeon]|nr:hypothetical protein [Euryarchaeota archaeon]